MPAIAHFRGSDKRVQTVKKHLKNVQALAEGFGTKLGLSRMAGLAGLLHDMGKLSKKFQDYIQEAMDNPDQPPKRGDVDHATAGGRLLYDLYGHKDTPQIKRLLVEIVGNVIVSHHSYLHDYLDPQLHSPYAKRINKPDIPEYEVVKRRFFDQVLSTQELHQYVNEAAIEFQAYLHVNVPLSLESRLMYVTKFLFSVLIDADRTDAWRFDEGVEERPLKESVQDRFRIYYGNLIDELRRKQESQGDRTAINQIRSALSEQCEQFASRASDIYTLSIPTGGGKTLASLRYALKHAISDHAPKQRIIYVVPYTTIIEQNASEVRRILEKGMEADSGILEHHSNIVAREDEDEGEEGRPTVRQKMKLARDNWDAPIIFTTMVQFLNVFYAHGSRNVRRLHNLCESVLIFDEVQKVPSHCVSLFNEALNFLKQFGRSSIVLCTATQPALDTVTRRLDISPDAEIVANLSKVSGELKRVEVVDLTQQSFNTERLGKFIEDQLHEVRNVLVILNTKAVVKKLYQHFQFIDCNVPIFHLSTSMCAAHRQKLLTKIKKRLEKKERLVCVTTPLIEAGVDISFQCVIRSLSGLDSIAQAAGRCNRHMEGPVRNVYVITHEEEELGSMREVKAGKQEASKILIDGTRTQKICKEDVLAGAAMRRYFQSFYDTLQADLNYYIEPLRRQMTQLLFAPRGTWEQVCKQNGVSVPPLYQMSSYRTAAKHFKVIQDHTTDVIVPYKEGKDVIADLLGASTISDLSCALYKAQQYTVSLYKPDMRQLERNGGVQYVPAYGVYILQESAYSGDYGLNVNNDSPMEDLMI